MVLLEVKLFCRTQRDLAISLNKLIDGYWNEDITEKNLRDSVLKLYENNKSKFIKNGFFTKTVEQQCGKRRLEVIERILKIQ